MNLLLELLLRASLLILAGLSLWALARNRSAESRVTLLRGTLVGLAILPALWAVGPRWAFNIPGMAKPAPIVVDLDLDMMTAGQQMLTEAPSRVDLLPFIYLGIALLVLIPAAIGHLILRKVWNQAKPLGWQLEDELSEALDTVGVRQKVQGRIGGINSPLVFGGIRRCVLLPANFLSWPEEHRRSALLHEAAHLKRFDCAWQHLAHGVRAVYWCHPLVWFLSRALKDETELAADERAIRSGAEAADYASALVAIARTLQAPGRLVRSQGVTFMNHRQLDRRVRSVLHGRRRGFSSLGSLAMAGFAALGTYLAAGANPQKPAAEIVVAQPVAVTYPLSTPIGAQVARPAPIQELSSLTKTVKGTMTVRVLDTQNVAKAARIQGKVIEKRKGSLIAPVAVTSTPRIIQGTTVNGTLAPTATTAKVRYSGTIAPTRTLNGKPVQGWLAPAQNTGTAKAKLIAPTATVNSIAVQGTIAPFNSVNGVSVKGTVAPAPATRSLNPIQIKKAKNLNSTNPIGTVPPTPLTISSSPAQASVGFAKHPEASSFYGNTTFKTEASLSYRLAPKDSLAGQAAVELQEAQIQKKALESLTKAEAFRADAFRALADKRYTEALQETKRAGDDAFRSTFSRAAAPRQVGVDRLVERSFFVNASGTKPVNIVIEIDGKRHQLKAVPGKDGLVRIVVDAKGVVKAISNRN